VKHPLPHAEIEFADPYDPVTEARSSSVDDHSSGRMHSLIDVNHPSPHAEIEFADPFDPVTEANILNMHHEKRATSHENENVETPKQGFKLSGFPGECSSMSQSMDNSSCRNQCGNSGSLRNFGSEYTRSLRSWRKGVSDISLLAGSEAPTLASMRKTNGPAECPMMFMYQSMDIPSFRNQRSNLGSLSKESSIMSFLAGSKAPSVVSILVHYTDLDISSLTFSS